MYFYIPFQDWIGGKKCIITRVIPILLYKRENALFNLVESQSLAWK
jgi:hypothetical protein